MSNKSKVQLSTYQHFLSVLYFSCTVLFGWLRVNLMDERIKCGLFHRLNWQNWASCQIDGVGWKCFFSSTKIFCRHGSQFQSIDFFSFDSRLNRELRKKKIVFTVFCWRNFQKKSISSQNIATEHFQVFFEKIVWIESKRCWTSENDIWNSLVPAIPLLIILLMKILAALTKF